MKKVAVEDIQPRSMIAVIPSNNPMARRIQFRQAMSDALSSGRENSSSNLQKRAFDRLTQKSPAPTGGQGRNSDFRSAFWGKMWTPTVGMKERSSRQSRQVRRAVTCDQSMILLVLGIPIETQTKTLPTKLQ